MKTKYISLIIAACVFCFASCEDSLNIEQHSVSSIDSYYQVDSEAEEGIVACYTAFRSVFNGIGGVQRFADMLSDDVWTGGGNHYDGTYYRLNDYSYDAAYSGISSIYNNLYTLIYRCNVVIEHVTGDSQVMKQCVAEAKVFRAFAYFYLTTLWGTPPLVDHCLTESEYMQANGNTADLWAFVETNLNEAISSGALSEKSGKGDVNYRITKQYAQALLGKAYLFQKKYAEAASMFENVISSNKYGLDTDLSNVGTPLVDVTAEDLMVVHYINDRSQSGTNNDFGCTFMGLRGEKYSYTAASPFASSTFGYINPRKDLYEDFVAVEGANGYRLNNTIATRDQMINNYGTVNIMEITDNEGYWNYKNRILRSIWAGYFYACNTRVMRYNEVLILAAEANLQGGNAAKATEYINQIRTRAQAPLVAGTVTMDQIKTESRIELCFSGNRFFNLVRWGDAATKLADNGKQNPALQTDGSVKWTSYNDASDCGFRAGKHELLPFPETEMSVNPNMVQNPGW